MITFGEFDARTRVLPFTVILDSLLRFAASLKNIYSGVAMAVRPVAELLRLVAFSFCFLCACTIKMLSVDATSCKASVELERAIKRRPSAEAYNAVGAYFAERQN